MRGMYDIIAYRELVASVSDRAHDVAYAKAWNKLARGTRARDDSSKTLFFYDDAFSSSLTLISEMASMTIDTSDHVFWLGVRDLVINTNRLVTLPDAVSVEGVTVREVVMSVAMLLDVVGRVADERRREHAIAVDSREFRARWTSIYIDLVTGRGGAWLAYVDDMGAEAAFLKGVSWAAERDRYAGMRIADYLGRAMRQFSIDQQGAGRLFSSQLLLCASVFDRIQRGTWERDGAKTPSLAQFASVLDLDIVGRVADNLLPTPEPGEDLSCYTDMFGVSAPGSVANIALEFETSVRKSLVQVINAAKGGREKSGAGDGKPRKRRLPR